LIPFGRRITDGPPGAAAPLPFFSERCLHLIRQVEVCTPRIKEPTSTNRARGLYGKNFPGVAAHSRHGIPAGAPELRQFAAAIDNASMTDKRLVLSTCGSREVATKIARALVDGQVAACVNILGPMESVYRWKGRVETSQEFLLLIKTTAENFERLCAEIRRLTSYELPEVLQFTVEAGLEAYLDWIGDSVTGTGP
jgi:periplasmic divalent cation tolerance protein